MINANGAKIYPMMSWKLIPKIMSNILLIPAIKATKPINIAATVMATLNPSMIYSPSISKKDCFSAPSSTGRISSSSVTV
jgi:hypothetical protein